MLKFFNSKNSTSTFSIAKNSNFNRNCTFWFYYIIRSIHTIFIFKSIFRKLIKFSLIFCVQNKKIFFSEKMFVPESKRTKGTALRLKKIVNFEKYYNFFCKVLTMANILRIQNKKRIS